MMTTRDDLQQQFKAAGLLKLVPHIEALAKPGIRLVATPVQAVEHGDSRLGGVPDAPQNFEWPRSEDSEPLVFVGQLNFSEIVPLDDENRLPTCGGLLFFAHIGDGLSLVPLVHGMVPDELVPLAPPDDLPAEDRLLLHSLEPRKAWTLPNYGLHGTIGGSANCFFDVFEPELEFLPLTHQEVSGYWAIRKSLGEFGHHQVFGHADYEQNPMMLEFERERHGDRFDNYLELWEADNPLTRELKVAAQNSDWQLLWQIAYFGVRENSCHEIFGDAGLYYLFITRADLEARRWNIRVDMQCG